MKLFFTKAERIRLLGFNDLCVMLLGIFPLAGLAHVLFGGASPGMEMGESASCYGVALAFTTVHWLVSRQVVLQLRNLFAEERYTALRIGLTLAVLVVSVILISLAAQPLVQLALQGIEIPQPSVFYKVVMTFTLTIMVVAAYEGMYFFKKYQQSLLEQEQLAKENMQAQLSVLKQQMNPHFLFNSLNTLVNIIPEDSVKATLFTQRLSAVYRRILEWRHKELITLEEEVRALQDYAFLMKTRFEDKLEVCWHFGAGTQVQCEGDGQCINLPAEVRNYRIVPLSLQLLVENAIKHNVVSSASPLRIDLTLANNRLTVTNRLNVRKESDLNSTGWGHQNLQARYEMITEEPVLITQTQDYYEVSIPVLPVKQAVQAATA